MSYNCKVLADSIAPHGVRLTTLEVTFPRFILAEFNTHRIFSRNSASSRAIPTEKIIEAVCENPFVPETFNKRVKGMGVGDALEDQEEAREVWDKARWAAVNAAVSLNQIDVDKSRVNRLLEPFMWHTVIVTATEWENFFALRCHPDAQPEMQKTAGLMRDALESSDPVEINYGQWHLPLVSREDLQHIDGGRAPAYVSAGRCARVSYDTQHNAEDIKKSLERATRLQESGHFSPFEHPATPAAPSFVGDKVPWVGNFKGWSQLRHFIPNESNFGRVEDA